MRTHPSHTPDSIALQRLSLLFWVLWVLSTLAVLLVAGPVEARSTRTSRDESDPHGGLVRIGNTPGARTSAAAP